MNIKEIPAKLFAEFSKKYCHGEEREILLDGKSYLVRDLIPNHDGIAFAGGLGLRVKGEHSSFIMIHQIPRGTDSIVPLPMIEVEAGPRYAGQWCRGKGHLMKEDVRVNFPVIRRFDRLPVEHASTLLTVQIILRTYELIHSPDCAQAEYWEAERKPGLDYSEPYPCSSPASLGGFFDCV